MALRVLLHPAQLLVSWLIRDHERGDRAVPRPVDHPEDAMRPRPSPVAELAQHRERLAELVLGDVACPGRDACQVIDPRRRSRCGRGGAVARARQRAAIPRQLRGGLGCVPGDLRRREPRERPQHRVRVRGSAPLKPLHHVADCLDQQLAGGLRHDPLLGSRLGHVPQHDARRHLGLESRRNTFRVTQYLQLAGQRVGELTAGRRR